MIKKQKIKNIKKFIGKAMIKKIETLIDFFLC